MENQILVEQLAPYLESRATSQSCRTENLRMSNQDLCYSYRSEALSQPTHGSYLAGFHVEVEPKTVVDHRSVNDIVEAEVLSLDRTDEDPFFVADLSEVSRQYERWTRELPGVVPFYAIKCCPDKQVVETLAQLGAGFDCASKTEMELALGAGVEPNRIIYANPCKQISHLKFAREKGIRKLTFDNADELYKVKQNHENAELVLRILPDDSKATCRLGLKFGASRETAIALLHLAKELHLNVIGVSFHVGSGCLDAQAFGDAVTLARDIFRESEKLGFQFQLLDLGGGFPGNSSGKIKFEEIASVLRSTIASEQFPSNVKIIAEPGRYFVSAAFTLAVQITSRRTIVSPLAQKSFMYYLNDGIYGSFNCIIFDHAQLTPKVLYHAGSVLPFTQPMDHFSSSLWGPTCDSIDCISKEVLLPELQVGDWLQFDAMGAYTMASASTFNGFKKTHVIYTNPTE